MLRLQMVFARFVRGCVMVWQSIAARYYTRMKWRIALWLVEFALGN